MMSLYGSSSLHSLVNLMSNEWPLTPLPVQGFLQAQSSDSHFFLFRSFSRDRVNHLPPVSSLISEHGYLDFPFKFPQ